MIPSTMICQVPSDEIMRTVGVGEEVEETFDEVELRAETRGAHGAIRCCSRTERNDDFGEAT